MPQGWAFRKQSRYCCSVGLKWPSTNHTLKSLVSKLLRKSLEYCSHFTDRENWGTGRHTMTCGDPQIPGPSRISCLRWDAFLSIPVTLRIGRSADSALLNAPHQSMSQAMPPRLLFAASSSTSDRTFQTYLNSNFGKLCSIWACLLISKWWQTDT